MDVVVSGIGLISALGNLDNTWNRLLLQESGIHFYQPFSELQPRPLGLVETFPSNLEALTQRLVVSALKDAQLPRSLPDCGVVIGSSRGNQAQWEQWAKGGGEGWGQQEAGSQHTRLISHPVLLAQHLSFWLGSLPHVAAVTTAQLIGTTAPVLSPMAACATGVWAIAQGYQLIQTGQCQRVIAGAVEAPITPLTLTGFERMGALAKTGAYPFDRDREGLVLGEGGAFLILETADLARSRGVQVYGRILGFGFTADGYHVSTPDPSGRTAIAAVKQCLDRSGVEPDAIDFIHAHGTGTQLNDRNEAHLIQCLFPSKVPVSSTKGATGHTLGASGALGTAFCLMALKQQQQPPCVGLKQPEWDLNFVRRVQSSPIHTTLCLSFGFGGQNAAIVLGR